MLTDKSLVNDWDCNMNPQFCKGKFQKAARYLCFSNTEAQYSYTFRTMAE